MKRALLAVTLIIAGCTEPNVTAKPYHATVIEGRWTVSDDWVEHVTIVTDKETNRDFLCFFGAGHMGYSRAMSCVRVGP